jgi:hypothetical protein
MAGFTLSDTDGEILYIREPLRVRRVRGYLRSEVGEWPNGARPLFELRKPQPGADVYRARADQQGWFELSDVSPDLYCFKATQVGWASVMGTIEVTLDSSRQLLIGLEMPLAN